MRGRFHVAAMPGWMPILTKVMPTLAWSCITRRSQARAKQSPAPIAWPLIAAIDEMLSALYEQRILDALPEPCRT